MSWCDPETSNYVLLTCEAALTLLSPSSLSAFKLGLLALHVDVEDESLLYDKPSPILVGLVRGGNGGASFPAVAEAGTVPAAKLAEGLFL